MQGKSPIRYPGGKSRFLDTLASYLPTTITEYREPFVGGGSTAFAAAARYPQASIWINDLCPAVANFWTVLQDPQGVVHLESMLLAYHGASRSWDAASDLYKASMANIGDRAANPVVRAASFYYVNRVGYSGTLRSTITKYNWSERWLKCQPRIRELRQWSALMVNWRITNLDYTAVLSQPFADDTGLVYCDPPYPQADRLYGFQGKLHNRFDHAGFQRAAEATHSCVLISYDASMQANYAGWAVCDLVDHGYSMASKAGQAPRQELIVANYIAPLAG